MVYALFLALHSHMLLDEADEGNAHARDQLNETGVKLQLILCFEQSRIVYRTFRSVPFSSAKLSYAMRR